MLSLFPDQNPIGSAIRRQRAIQRLGPNAKCTSCGEDRMEALVRNANSTVSCQACILTARGRSGYEKHHVAGRRNHSSVIVLQANDHRGLSALQYHWPKATLTNPSNSPLIRASACIRGFVDSSHFLNHRRPGYESSEALLDYILWIPKMLEDLDSVLINHLGNYWWIGTAIEQFAGEGHA